MIMENNLIQVVKVKLDLLSQLLKLFIILFPFVSGFFLFNTSILFLGAYSLLLLGVPMLIVFLLLRNFKFEFEYTFSSGMVNIDKIIANRNRKPIIPLDLKNISSFDKITTLSKEELDHSNIPCIYAHDGIRYHIYYADYINQDGSKIRVFFSPDEAIRNQIQKYLSR